MGTTFENSPILGPVPSITGASYSGSGDPFYTPSPPPDRDNGKSPIIVSQSHAPITRNSDNATDTVEVVHASVVLPAGLMGKNGMADIEVFWEYTNSASSKTLLTRFGSATVAAPTVTTTQNSAHRIIVRNQANVAAQKVSNTIQPYQALTTAVLDRTEDTDAPVTIEFRSKWGANVAGETIALRGYRVIVTPSE